MMDKKSVELDGTTSVRPGEGLDEPALTAYLAEHLAEVKPPFVVEQFPRGHSNLTYLLRDAAGLEMVLRRPPFGSQVKTAHDMGREHRVLAALHPVYPKAPRPVLYCDDSRVLGAPFYLMERVTGVVLRGTKPRAAAELDAAAMQRVCTALVDTLAELHAVDVDAAGLSDFGHPDGYVQRQVDGWIARYAAARTDAIGEVEAMAAWLQTHVPDASGVALVHNDFKYDNLVLDPDDLTRVRAVLDWEMATVGDPLMDLGTTLGYWIDPDDPPEAQMLPFGPTALPGNLSRAEVVARYAEVSGRDVGDALFYYVFGLLKIAGIAQQIYRRFVDGKTRDPRFAMMIVGVRVLGMLGVRALEKA